MTRSDISKSRHTCYLLVCVIVSVLALIGCTDKSATSETQPDIGLPAVTYFAEAGGQVALAEVEGRALILTDSGVLSVAEGRVEMEFEIPTGFSVQPIVINERLAVLTERERFGTLAIWDLAAPDDTPKPIVVDNEIASYMVVDLLGSDTPELVLVTTDSEQTGSPHNCHQRIEVWSLEGDHPERLYGGDFVPEDRVSLIGHVCAIDIGFGDDRPELLWEQVDAPGSRGGDSRLIQLVPSEDFRAYESERFDRWLWLEGFRQDESGTKLLLSRTFGEDLQTMVMEVQEESFRRLAEEVDASDFELPKRTEETYRNSDGAPMPADHCNGLVLRRLRGEYGSSVEVTFADGDKLLLELEKPIFYIRDAGLADLDGDGEDELVVIADGEPSICSDTNTGYVGWAERREDGSFGEVQWSEPLGGGLAGLAIADIDGQPGEEIIVGIYETFCNPIPVGLWIFSP